MILCILCIIIIIYNICLYLLVILSIMLFVILLLLLLYYYCYYIYTYNIIINTILLYIPIGHYLPTLECIDLIILHYGCVERSCVRLSVYI